jgi:hypothetical protein
LGADVAQALYVLEVATGRVEYLLICGVCGDDFHAFLRKALIFEFLFESV